MKFKGEFITASLGSMSDCVNIMAGTYNERFLVNMNEHCFMFRSGAKLVLCAWGKWRIHGYSADKSDITAALLELRSADHVRQAINLRRKHNEVMATPNSLRPTYIGLHGIYPNGERTLR